MSDLCESKGTAVNNINLILLVAILCNSKAKYGIAPNTRVAFETEMGCRDISMNYHISFLFYIRILLFMYRLIYADRMNKTPLYLNQKKTTVSIE